MSTSRTRWRAPLRAGLAVAGAAALAMVTSGIAEAHVTAQPGVAAKGSYAKIAFRVPTESATAGTVKLEVTLPTDHPIPSVLTTPMPGWTATTAKTTLNPPVETDDGKVTEAVHTITWTAQPGVRLAPGQFADFEVNLGALPDNTDSLVMPAVQTYDDGTVVSWDQTQTPGGPEPEHPAPTLKLVDGGGGAHDMGAAMHGMAQSAGPDAEPGSSAGGVDNTARWLGGIGLVLGALGLGLGGGAALRGRRNS
ncbi:MAG TPA: YcnI family protein [Pseudonocardia sp.]|nr:YcnI family protein [Pseudonocardia sp.]